MNSWFMHRGLRHKVLKLECRICIVLQLTIMNTIIIMPKEIPAQRTFGRNARWILSRLCGSLGIWMNCLVKGASEWISNTLIIGGNVNFAYGFKSPLETNSPYRMSKFRTFMQCSKRAEIFIVFSSSSSLKCQKSLLSVTYLTIFQESLLPILWTTLVYHASRTTIKCKTNAMFQF